MAQSRCCILGQRQRNPKRQEEISVLRSVWDRKMSGATACGTFNLMLKYWYW